MDTPAYRYERLYEAKVRVLRPGGELTQLRFYYAPDLATATNLAVRHICDGEQLLGITQLFDYVVAYA